jgi:hypothetical protein
MIKELNNLQSFAINLYSNNVEDRINDRGVYAANTNYVVLLESYIYSMKIAAEMEETWCTPEQRVVMAINWNRWENKEMHDFAKNVVGLDGYTKLGGDEYLRRVFNQILGNYFILKKKEQ